MEIIKLVLKFILLKKFKRESKGKIFFGGEGCGGGGGGGGKI